MWISQSYNNIVPVIKKKYKIQNTIFLLLTRYRLLFPIFMLCCSFIHAGPKILVQSPIVEAGTSMEGVDEALNFHFSFKNSGTSPLHIIKIVPSCGCTKITRYDTLVMQGKSGTIHGEINLKIFAPGPVSKIVNVFSNAENDSILRLGVKATVRSIVEIREPYVTINERDSARKSFEVLSLRDSLKITGVTFKRDPDGSASGQSVWQSDIPVPISFRWVDVNTKRKDSYKTYLLTLIMPAISESMLGKFHIQTSCPEKPELIVRGTLLK